MHSSGHKERILLYCGHLWCTLVHFVCVAMLKPHHKRQNRTKRVYAFWSDFVWMFQGLIPRVVFTLQCTYLAAWREFCWILGIFGSLWCLFVCVGACETSQKLQNTHQTCKRNASNVIGSIPRAVHCNAPIWPQRTNFATFLHFFGHAYDMARLRGKRQRTEETTANLWEWN